MRRAVDDLMRFHLLGRPIESDVPAVSTLLPAALAPYRDLAELRYDFPLVLTDDPPLVTTLTDLTNQALRSVAPRGPAGERLRQHALRMEAAIRRLSANGQRGSVRALWDLAAEQLDAGGDDERLRADVAQVFAALPVDGQLVDCDEDAPSLVVTHLWTAAHRAASHAIRRRLDALVLGLSGILRAHDARSDEGRSAAQLNASLGGDHRASFDFDAWSAILGTGSPPTISDARRRRIRSTLATLEAQRFFPAIGTAEPDPVGTYPYLFRSCVAAAAAYRERVPAMVELVKAVAIAELELRNGYREAECDPYFDGFDEGSLTREDLGLFPSYLVCLTDEDLTADEQAQVIRALGSHAPIKVVVEVRDVLGEPPGPTLASVAPVSAIVGRQLGRMAMAGGTAFVVQTASSHLLPVIERIRDGLTSVRPALFSVFTGSTEHVPTLARYLVAAAAVQSRAVPTFVFDPDAGPGWADRFDLAPNPVPEEAWPTGTVAFEDGEMQRQSTPTSFSLADFAALDRRYEPHLTVAPPRTWHDRMRPAAEVDGPIGTDPAVPYLVMTTEDGTLHRVVVDRELLRTAHEFGAVWRSLQEHAGIHDSRALAMLAAERARWEAERGEQLDGASAPAVTADTQAGTGTVGGPGTVASTELPDDRGTSPVTEPVTSTGEPSDDTGEREPTPEEPYIETTRCTTCDECTDLNPRMFAYDDNKQAYIADLSAGSYREMVEAAEACQVAIIHPGLPWDPEEPDLAELIVRAAEFA